MIDLPAPYKDASCTPDSGLPVLSYFSEYSKSACIMECLGNVTVNMCNCTNPFHIGENLLKYFVIDIQFATSKA